jgi:hypothetical protein
MNGDNVDPVMLYDGVSGGEDENSCEGDTGGPICDQGSTRSKWRAGAGGCAQEKFHGFDSCVSGAKD